MRMICRISGEEFFASEDFSSDTERRAYQAEHPIFLLSGRDLTAKARNYGAGRYSLREEKLLFLALLNKTNSILWTIPAAPRPSIVKQNIEKAFKLVSWLDNINPGTLQFPKLRISQDNYELTAIHGFFSAWNSVRQEYMRPAHLAQIAEQQEAREFMLHKLIHSPAVDSNRYAGRLCVWALDACEIEDQDLRAEYTELFTLSDDTKIITANRDELLGLMATLQKGLYSVGSYGETRQEQSATALRHMQRILDINKGGWAGRLQSDANPGGTIFSNFQIKQRAIQDGQFSRLVDEDEETFLRAEIAEVYEKAGIAPLESEPTLASCGMDFKRYIKARPAWINTEDLRLELAALLEKKLKTLGI